VAENTWSVPLEQDTSISVFLATRRGRVIAFAVVLLAQIDGRTLCVARYDTAHGCAHRDILGRWSGLLKKEWLVDLTPNDAFHYALKDLRENYEHHIAFFLAH